MDTDLMHSSRLRLAQHHGRLAVVAEALETGYTVLPFLGDFAHAYLVGYHLDRLGADHFLFGELAFHSADVLLVNLK